MTLVRLMLCCNDWRNGSFSGRCSQIALDEGALTLESPYADSALKCHIGETGFRLGKDHTWRHYRHTAWLGNWCWDGILVALDCAADVLNFAINKGYRPSVGHTDLWEKMDRGEPLKAADLIRCAIKERRATR